LRWTLTLFPEVVQDDVDFTGFKAGNGDIQVDRRQKHREILELLRQNLAIPTGPFRELVIGQNEGSHKRVAKPVDANDGNSFHAEQPCCGVAGVAGEN
jgi:hypothetical protein